MPSPFTQLVGEVSGALPIAAPWRGAARAAAPGLLGTRQSRRARVRQARTRKAHQLPWRGRILASRFACRVVRGLQQHPRTAGLGSAQAPEQEAFFQGTRVPGAAGQEGPHPPQLHPPTSGAKSSRANASQLCTKINPVPREPCMGSWGQGMAPPATSPLTECTHSCGAV